MTPEEIISEWMEPRKHAIYGTDRSANGWWVRVTGKWRSVLAVCPEIERLGRLHEVEARLTDQQMLKYIVLLSDSTRLIVCASAEQKIAALTAVSKP